MRSEGDRRAVITPHLLGSGWRARVRGGKRDHMILVVLVPWARCTAGGLVVVGSMGCRLVLEHDRQAARGPLQRYVMSAMAQAPYGKHPAHPASDQRDQKEDSDEGSDSAHHDGTTFRLATGQPGC